MKNLSKIMVVLMGLMIAGAAHAEEAAAAAGTVAAEGSVKGMTAIAAAVAIALAVLGGATAQGKTATAYLEGVARNPSAQDKMFVPMILGLALIESLVLFAFVIAFLIK